MKILAVILGVFALVCVFGYVSAYNMGNRMEQQIIAVYENNEAVLGQYGQKVQEAAQVPGMMTEDLKEVIASAMTGRYGEDGSNATFQWIQENYPGQVDSNLYLQIQQIIESGRDDFTREQKRLVDIKRSYRTALGSFWNGLWLKIAGYPTINVGFNGPDDYPAITTTRANEVFKEGVEKSPIKVR